MSRLDAHAKALLIVQLAQSKKASDIVILDVQAIPSIADFFVICSGRSTKQTQTIADEIDRGLGTEGLPPRHREGYEEGAWVLLDCGDILVHIFLPPTREFYGLERLWGDVAMQRIDSESSAR